MTHDNLISNFAEREVDTECCVLLLCHNAHVLINFVFHACDTQTTCTPSQTFTQPFNEHLHPQATVTEYQRNVLCTWPSPIFNGNSNNLTAFSVYNEKEVGEMTLGACKEMLLQFR